MKKRLFTDFDGPLVDVSERYYQVYLICVERTRLFGQPTVILPKSKFWELKRSQVSETDIARLSGLTALGQPETFSKIRRELVHTPPFFPFDRLSIGSVSALDRAVEAGIELALITMRRRRELEPALVTYGLERFFAPERQFCLRDDYQKTGDTNDKPMLMARAIAELAPADCQWIVGDTEADILAGKRYRVGTIGILSGIRNKQQLALHHPDVILADLTAAVEFAIAN